MNKIIFSAIISAIVSLPIGWFGYAFWHENFIFAPDVADVIIKGLAVLGAGLFFLYKVSAGFNNQNLSLSLDCTRFPHLGGTENLDLVIAKIGIEKGTIAALTLEGIEARFKWGDAKNEAMQMAIEIHRLKVIENRNPGQPQVEWVVEPDRPHLYFSPGERTVFSCSSRVPRNAHCQVEIIAFGRRKRSSFLAQWRASSIAPAGYYVHSGMSEQKDEQVSVQ